MGLNFQGVYFAQAVICNLHHTLIIFLFTVKEMKQKRRSSILETVVKPRRFTTNIGTMGSPKSPHKINLPKVPSAEPVSSTDPSGTSDSPIIEPATAPAPVEKEAIPKAPPRKKKEKDSPKVSQRKVEVASSNDHDQKENKERWSISDLPSLQLHGQDFPALVNMLEQVSFSSYATVLLLPFSLILCVLYCGFILGAASAPGRNTSAWWI